MGKKLAIGFPVYNGEKYIGRALDSILSQDFTDFEIIICDNASTDRTQDICLQYAERDARIRYVRNPENLGAGRNYDRCFHETESEYFKWQAHDDELEPGFLSRAIAALDAEPDAVLWASAITVIDADGNAIRQVSDPLEGVDSQKPAHRYRAMLRPHSCTTFFGVFRRSALGRTQLHGTFYGSDKVMLTEVALTGRVIYDPEPFFRNRDHDDAYSNQLEDKKMGKRDRALAWLDTRNSDKRVYSYGIMLKRYWGMIGKHVPSRIDRLGCYYYFFRLWLLRPRLIMQLCADFIWWTAPAALEGIRSFEKKYIGFRKPKKHF
ncbi:MAG: glycosyltransferase family 2 protein [Pseudomonadota bacterium]